MKTILLVDDDHDILSSLEEILGRSDYTIIPKPGAEAALSVIREGTRVDLVVTDYSMPGMDVHEYFAGLKQALPSVPVIILTGHSSVKAEIQSLGAGLFECVNKPIEPKVLRRIVQSALDRS